MTNEQLCARARGHVRNNARVGWVLIVLAPFVVAAYVHSLLQLRDPRLIGGMLWGLGTFCYFVWASVIQGRGRSPEVPCAQFLRHVLEAKRRWALNMRRVVWLSVPAVLAVWWGGGPLMRVKSMGIRSPTILRLVAGPAPLIVTAILLACVWFAMAEEARRLQRDIEKLDQ